MKIDIESLSYDELLALNQEIVERLQYLDAVNTHQKMMQFAPGDDVSFESPHGPQRGILTKFNKKTVTVITKSGKRWNVSPHLLTKVVQSKLSAGNKDNVIGLKR